MNVISIAYDELLDVFTSKRNYANVLPVSHRGRLYSIGFINNSTQVTAADTLRQTFYIDSEGNGYNNFYGVNSPQAAFFTFSYNQDPGDLKIFDKITIKSSGGGDNLKLFNFTTDVDTGASLDLTTSDISSGLINKNIIPVFAGEGNGRVKGSYLRVQVKQNVNPYTQAFNVFSVTTHSRKIII
mgnify:FL=1